MTSSDAFTLLPADPTRGLDPTDLEAAEDDFDGSSYGYGMHTAAGAARLRVLTNEVRQVLAAGLGRDVALLALLGGCVRLERDGHGEYSDTVVRESICADLEDACRDAGVAPFADDEVAEVSLSFSLRSLDTYRNGFTTGLAAHADQ